MRRLPQLFFVSVFCLLAHFVSAQVSGVVNDATDKPIKGAKIFINKTSISAESGIAGDFALTGINPGFVEMIIYKKGFLLFKSPIRIQEGRAFKLNLKLTAEAEASKSGRQSGNRAENIQLLSKAMIGSGPWATQTSIINPQDAIFSVAGDTVKVNAKEPLVIENKGLGYRITYYMEAKDIDIKNLLRQISIRFDTLASKTATEVKAWKANRDRNFFGSRRHLFSSMAFHKVEDQGFLLENEQGKKINADSVTNPVKAAGYTVVKLKGATRVTYHVPGVSDQEQVSTITTKADLAVNEEGLLLNDKTVEISGAMNVSGLADMMPNNFFTSNSVSSQRATAELMRRFQEKVYVQTDKPYYYPGEAIWMKAYMNYFEKNFRDSLSKVLYVELIDPKVNTVLHKTIRIDHGSSRADFVLPDTLKPGDYHLRAYTNLMRNFHDEGFFTKLIHVLKPTDQVNAVQIPERSACSAGVAITTNKPVYKLREKILLNISMADGNQAPLGADLSVAVTDAVQVVPVPESNIIVNGYNFDKDSKTPMPNGLRYFPEFGISFKGQFTSDRGRKEKSDVTIVQGDFEKTIMTSTNNVGVFYETGYEFYDTLKFSFQGQSDKGKPQGKIQLIKDVPEAKFADNADEHLNITPTNVLQRVDAFKAPGEATVLGEVSVTATRIKGSAFLAKRYGKTRIFPGDKLFGADMLTGLMGMIPGLKISYARDEFGSQQILTMKTVMTDAKVAKEPLVYVNDMYRGGGTVGQGLNAVSALSLINPKDVDRVEVINTANPNMMISMEGGEGLIAIYLKPNAGIARGAMTRIGVEGFSRPHFFIAPEYDTPGADPNIKDYRATIYWNADVKTDVATGKAAVSFFASDLPGKYHVVLEGVTSEGKPVRCEQFFEVADK